MMPQFDRTRNKVVDFKNVASGTYLFFIGLFKKLVIADTFAVWANSGFSHPGDLVLIQAWVTSLSYTLQLYYDFSGYTDMALGSSQMFNIKLPINFDSPYRSLNIQEFWRRWHMTLGRFMKEYVYIPLGGNRISGARTLLNLMLTFFVVGLWHGAGWTFVFWGCLHGAALVIYRLWRSLHINLPKWLAWFLTFHFVNASWVFFRAKHFGDAASLLKGMAGINGIAVTDPLQGTGWNVRALISALGGLFGNIGEGRMILFMLLIFLPSAIFFRNSNEMAKTFRPNTIQLVFLSVVAFLSVLYLGTRSEFLYFRF
jgi:alginate O-acetyltransferase complex protein AlgI